MRMLKKHQVYATMSDFIGKRQMRGAMMFLSLQCKLNFMQLATFVEKHNILISTTRS